MKKLSLEMLRLTSDEVLQRSQMKKITGGYGGICFLTCNNWTNQNRPMAVPYCSATVSWMYCTGGSTCTC